MSCWDTVQAYAFRSLGFGEKLLPKSDFTLCEHFTLIGSGLIWNIYFGALALFFGFFFAAFRHLDADVRQCRHRVFDLFGCEIFGW